MTKRIISICIPTYNGEKTIEKTLNSLIDQILQLSKSDQDKIEIILNDDCSKDGTYALIEEKYLKFSFLNLNQNEQNLGMDGNFEKVAKLAQGEYIWYFGQDDLLLSNSLNEIIDHIDKYHPNIISLNYVQVNEDDEIIDESVHRTRFIGDGKFLADQPQFFNSKDEYFKYFNSAPTFLPATLFKSKFWEDFDSLPYQGTAYAQLGCILENINNGFILVDNKIRIRGLIPSNKWQSDGTQLLNNALGNLKAKRIALERVPGCMPMNLYYRQKKEFLYNFYFLIGNAKRRNLVLNDAIKEDLKFLFDNNFVLSLYIYPILNRNILDSKILFLFANNIKALILRFSKFLKLNIKKF